MAASPPETIKTPLTELLGIKYPVLLAGMNVVAGAELGAAVSNAGGLGMIGGVGYTPQYLTEVLDELKAGLDHPDLPFGVDLLLPQVGGGARKTNYDYTDGKLPELIDIVINSGARLFVSAVGVPPKWAVDKLHAAGIPCMNMIGSPRHVKKALDVGIDIICAQGTEGGGHTGAVATSVLIPQVVDLCRGRKSPLTGGPVYVVAAGGIFDGRGLAMALSLGADAVWVGTAFITAEESGAPPAHQRAVVETSSEGTHRSLIYTGRPLRIRVNDYSKDWEENRQQELKTLLSQGTLPFKHDMEKWSAEKRELSPKDTIAMRPLLMGQAAGAIGTKGQPAKQIIHGMVSQAIDILRGNTSRISRL